MTQQESSRQSTKFFQKGQKDQNWYIFDAKGKNLGRLASEIAKVLRGKHTPYFSPNTDMGDGVIVVNAKHVAVTGNKEAQKVYYRHTGFLGGLKATPYRSMMEKHPTRIIEHAVKGMMPKNKLGRAMLKKLRVFAGDKHDLEAQKPIQAGI